MLEDKAEKLRNNILDMMVRMNQGHPGSIFSLVEVICTLYYTDISTLNSGYSKQNRDKLIISKGHATHVVYPLLEEFGYIEMGSCALFGSENHNNGPLRVFGNIKINGIDCTTGSLGHGIGVGCGYSLSDKKLENNDHKTFVIISEGEQYEGSVWEAALFAAHYKLSNLIVIIDRNNQIILGNTESCLALEPISDKWESFGWETKVCNGHNSTEIYNALLSFNSIDKPKLLIANTTKGKGSRIMENRPEWHYWHSDKKHLLK